LTNWSASVRRATSMPPQTALDMLRAASGEVKGGGKSVATVGIVGGVATLANLGATVHVEEGRGGFVRSKRTRRRLMGRGEEAGVVATIVVVLLFGAVICGSVSWLGVRHYPREPRNPGSDDACKAGVPEPPASGRGYIASGLKEGARDVRRSSN
jgi:hypothetical protein